MSLSWFSNSNKCGSFDLDLWPLTFDLESETDGRFRAPCRTEFNCWGWCCCVQPGGAAARWNGRSIRVEDFPSAAHTEAGTIHAVPAGFEHPVGRSLIVDVVVYSLVELLQGGTGGLSVLRTFRLLRILKLVRFMPALRYQLVVMLRTMDNVAMFFALLVLFIFIFRWVLTCLSPFNALHLSIVWSQWPGRGYRPILKQRKTHLCKSFNENFWFMLLLINYVFDRSYDKEEVNIYQQQQPTI